MRMSRVPRWSVIAILLSSLSWTLETRDVVAASRGLDSVVASAASLANATDAAATPHDDDDDDDVRRSSNHATYPTANCEVGHVYSDGGVGGDDENVSSSSERRACFRDRRFADDELVHRAGVAYREVPRALESANATNNTASLLLDLWTPPPSLEGVAPRRRPAVVVLHGGHCREGARDDPRPSFYARAFAARGWIAASVDYRLLSVEDSCRTVGAIEAAGADARAAARWLAARADVDVDRIVVTGCSAGGRVALYASYARDGEPVPDVAACVEVSADAYAPRRRPGPLMRAGDPPLLIVHGALDPNRWTKCSVAEDNYQRAVEAGVYSEKYVLPDQGHCPDFDMDVVFDFLSKALSLDRACDEDDGEGEETRIEESGRRRRWTKVRSWNALHHNPVRIH